MKWLSLLCGLMALVNFAAADTTVNLTLEQSSDPGGPWQPVQRDLLPQSAVGEILDQVDTPERYYRVGIRNDADLPFRVTMPQQEVPEEILNMVQEFVHATTNVSEETSFPCFAEQGWEGAELSPLVYCLYNPAIFDGMEPAYLEFVLRSSTSTNTPENTGFLVDPPELTEAYRGHIIVSLTSNDMPVVEFSMGGEGRVRTLHTLAGASNVKAMYYDAGLILAENLEGNVVANIGSEPYWLPEELLSYEGETFDSLHEDGLSEGGFDPDLVGIRPFTDYAEYKTTYVSDPVYEHLRLARRTVATEAWAAYYPSEQPAAIAAEKLTRQSNPAFGWGSWKSWHAGTSNDQRWYTQLQKISTMNPAGASGCGPTAWRMLYGWWDVKGVTGALANPSTADAPNHGQWNWYNLLMRLYMVDCEKQLYDWCGTFNTGSQAATLPWKMDAGYQWAPHRSIGYSVNSSWGVPGISAIITAPRDKARDGIKAGRPAPIGIGFYQHYVIAYEYYEHPFFLFGLQSYLDTWFYVNNGWGKGHKKSATWYPAGLVWFGANARFW